MKIFKGTSRSFLQEIVMRLRSEVCLGGDTVYSQGDTSNCIYFVRSGAVEIAAAALWSAKEYTLARVLINSST